MKISHRTQKHELSLNVDSEPSEYRQESKAFRSRDLAISAVRNNYRSAGIKLTGDIRVDAVSVGEIFITVFTYEV